MTCEIFTTFYFIKVTVCTKQTSSSEVFLSSVQVFHSGCKNMSIRCASKSANRIQKSQALLSRVVLKDKTKQKKYNYLFCHNKKFFSFGNRSILHHQLKASLQGIDFQLLETGINLCISIKMLTLNGMKI